MHFVRSVTRFRAQRPEHLDKPTAVALHDPRRLLFVAAQPIRHASMQVDQHKIIDWCVHEFARSLTTPQCSAG